LVFFLIFRNVRFTLPDFDFTIDGEAAWAVIELDLVKNDKTTEKQEKIWRSRDNRTDLNDPMFLLSKQTRLEMYFILPYTELGILSRPSEV
jgi:hypothetical protein